MTRHRFPLLAASLAIPAFAHGALAQADFAESFEDNGATQGAGPANLIAQGWVFRNQSDPVNGPAWYDGNGFGGQPFEGAGYLAADSLATDFLGGSMSVWAILPPIPGQAAGDEFSLWVFGGGAAVNDTYLEVRYAPSGTGTGGGPDDVGDFTTVLHSSELPLATTGYQRISAQVPGAGRIAIRFRADYIMTFAGHGAYISLDGLTVGPPPADPCGVPIPAPGQTVVWAATEAPYSICQDLLIPETGEVIVEPGAQIIFDPGAKVRVDGVLSAIGSGASPIAFTGSSALGDGFEVGPTGTLEAEFVDVGIDVHASGPGATMIFRDATFGPEARLTGPLGVAVVERCEFQGDGSAGAFLSLAGSVRITDSDFSGGALGRITGLTFIQNVTAASGGLSFEAESVAHPVFLDDISVTGVGDAAGISISGPNYLFGDNVITQDNLYPVSIDGLGAGILPGSALPAAGNTNNYIPVPELLLGFNRHWADTGLPYVVQGGFPANYGGSLVVEPGTNIKFGPGAGAFLVLASEIKLQGTREEPIVIESRFAGAGRWFGLKWVDNFDAKATHTIFDGGEITLQSDGGYLDLYNCTVRNSLEATASVTGGIVRLHGSRVVNNNVGMVTTTSGRIEADGSVSPSIFEGNAVAIDYNNTNGTTPFLRFNWWGDSTGPTSPLNPGGMGDVVQDVHPAAFTPFLSAPPAQDDDFPVVDMEPTYFMADSGSKIILRWASSDDHAVVAHRVEFANHDFPNEFVTVATLPGDANTYEFTAPVVAPNNLYPTPSAIRIVAVDDLGQESWDKSVLRIPYQEDWTVFPQEVTDPGLAYPHQTIDVCWSPGGNADVHVLLDGIAMSDSAGGSNTGCLPIGARLPYSSTDTARILVLTTFGAGGRIHYSFSDYFSIRPDALFGDEPPSISTTSPTAGQHYTGGGVVPVRWAASDDEALRSFSIQASYDAGRTWHFVARDLPGEARAFDWRLPASGGIADVRVRVVAFDKRFQESSSTTGAIEILAGDSGGCPADLAEPLGQLDFSDVVAFLAAFGNMDPAADFAAPLGQFDFSDVVAFLTAFGAGCP